MTFLLAGDIGGTKSLLSLYRCDANGLEQLVCERYVSADWPDLAPMVQAFHNGPAAGLGHPQAACFAVAGPVQAGLAHLTNLPWQLTEQDLAAATGVARLALVNDFEVLIYGLPHLQPDQQALIRQGVAVATAPILVLGAGTGLGVSYGIQSPTGLQAIASEGAHAEFAPRSAAEWQLKQWLQADLGLDRVSIERVVSGTGLGMVARWLLATRSEAIGHPLAAVAADPHQDLPAAVSHAAEAGDGLAQQALSLWLSAYGSVTGDLALATLCRGGIWVAGGTAAKLLPALQSPAFTEAFLNKGRLGEVLKPIPITAIVDPAIGLYSAACRARMLVG